MEQSDVTRAVHGSSLSALAWHSASGPRCRGVVALVRRDRPVLAFTYADEAVAREVIAAGTATLALTDPRGTRRGFRPLLLRAGVRLVEDPEGTVFTAELLEQELLRFPPSRVLADSPLLQREHWWYLPRLLVELDVEHVETWDPAPPSDPDGSDLGGAGRSHLLVTAADRPTGAVDVHRVDVVGEDDRVLELALEPRDRAPAAGPALLFGQDAAFPDLERWTQWSYRGEWEEPAFTVVEAPARRGLGPAPGLLQRWRRQRDLERRCRRALPPVS
jgi:hypothetical protein